MLELRQTKGNSEMTCFDARSELTTERLNLVPCSDEHLDGLSAMNSDPEVMRYITGRPETRLETQAMIERVKERWTKFGYSWWTIIERATGEIIGAGCIQNLRRCGNSPDPDCPLEIGWRLRKERRGRGYATEAACAMANFAFARLRAEVLYAVCHPDNSASMKVMERLGMNYRGREMWYAQEAATFAITAEEWRQAGPK